jgi:diacylglycerol kinase
MSVISEFLSKRKKSFSFALKGLKFLFSTQINAKIEIFATLIIVLIGILFELTRTEWLFVFLAIFIVMICETINTIVELICNRITTDFDKRIETIKDLSSGMVLISVIFSIITGLFIFIPKILQFIGIF